MKFIIPATLLIVAIVLAILSTKISDPPKMVTREFPIMGTFAKVKLFGNPETTPKAADAVNREFMKVQTICNIFDPDSEISKLNKTAADKPFACGDLLWDVLMKAKYYHSLSNGAFDITAKPLMDLWGFYRKRGESLPSPEETKEKLSIVGLDKVIFDEKLKTVKFTKPGMKFDLGGIAKGYAVDLAAKAVMDLGVKSGIINLGGNMYCLPVPFPDKKAYSIGVRHPKINNDICGKVKILNQSVATSGNYERYVTIDGKQYTHIMNVKTGQPVADTLSVTVITPSACAADALSTSIFINGANFAESIIQRVPATHVLIIKNGKGGVEIKKLGEIWGEISDI